MFGFSGYCRKICALSLLHRGSLKYRFYFENSHCRLKLHVWVKSQVGATNSYNSVGMMRFKEQESIFTGLWITFWWLSKPVGKSRSRKYPQGFEKNHHRQHLEVSCISKSNTGMRILFLSRRFPLVRFGYVTDVNWPRGAGKTPYRDKAMWYAG